MKRTIKPDWPLLLLVMAISLGAAVRLMPALTTHFPINDGGMFYAMSQDLSASGYALPETTSYNNWNLPYAYPPFGIYFASFLSDVGHIPLLDVFLWLPPLLSILAIPAFYLLARALLADGLSASLGTVFFALAPGRYDWHIMGGGVTRAFGLLFLLFGAYFVVRLFRTGNWKTIIPATLFCSLAVLSHPEVALQTAGLCFVFWFFFGRTRPGLLHAIMVAIGVLLLTAPWWGTILGRHGLAPFLSAAQTGQHATIVWRVLLLDLFSIGGFLPLLLLLQVTGLIHAFWKRQFIFIVLVIVPVLVDPRSAASISHLSLSLLAALGFLAGIPALVGKIRGIEMDSILDSRPGAAVLFILTFTLFIECGLLNFRSINTTLTAGEREAMGWIRENLPPNQDFLLLTGRPYSMSDPVQEWFPVFGGGHSQTTLQGLEWTLGSEFTDRLNDLADLQSCSDLACVDAWSTRTGLTYDFLWVNTPFIRENPLDDPWRFLVETLQSSNRFTIVFQEVSSSAVITVFKKNGE